jgi:hypothetical protein
VDVDAQAVLQGHRNKRQPEGDAHPLVLQERIRVGASNDVEVEE